MPFWRRKPPPIGGAPTGQLGGKSGRINDWPKCRQCWHRVPAATIHTACRRASVEASGPVPHTHLGGKPCCPGWCRVCGICWDRNHMICGNCGRCILECPGICNECGNCLDKCKGHNESRDEE